MKPLIRKLNELAYYRKSFIGLLTSLFGYKVSNPFFADGCLIFAKASSRGARKVLEVLNWFANILGQQINFNKSFLYFSSNTTNQIQSEIVNILQIQHKTTIGKYLGIHNIIFWNDPLNGNKLVKRFKQKLAGWKAHTLLKAGRIQSNL